MLDDMHPWTPSIHLPRKTVPCCFLHTNFLLQCLYAELCKNQQAHVVEGLYQPTEGSGLTEWSPVKCAFSEHSRTSSNLPSEPRENPGIAQGWHWAGTPSQGSTEALCHMNPDLGFAGARCSHCSFSDRRNTAGPPTLFYPGADHWH